VNKSARGKEQVDASVVSASMRSPLGYRSLQWLWFFGYALVLWAVFGWHTYQARSAVISQENSRLLSQAKVIEANLTQQLNSINRILGHFVDDYSRHTHRGVRAFKSDHLSSFPDALPGIRVLFVLDAEGRVVASSRSEFLARDFSARADFVAARDLPAGRLMVSKPYRAQGPTTASSISRTMRRPDGTFLGVVMAVLDPGYIEVLLQSVNDLGGMWSAVAHPDGSFLAQVPQREAAAENGLAAMRLLFARSLEGGRKNGLITSDGRHESWPEMVAVLSFQPTQLVLDQPLVIAVARDREMVLADWQTETTREILLLLLLSLGAVIVLRWLQNRQTASEANFRLLVQGAPYGLALLNADGVVSYFNPAFSRMTGYSIADVPTVDRWFELAYPDPEYRARVISEWQAVDAQPKAQRSFLVSCANGEDRQIQFQVATLSDQRKLISFEDITERHRAEAALRETAERLQRIFDAVPSIAVQGYASDGTVRYWNPASQALYGYAPEEALGRNLVDLIIPPPMRSAVRTAVEEMIARGEGDPTAELVLMNRDRQPVPVLSSHVVVRLPGTEPQLYCLDVDLRQLKAAQLSLSQRESLLRQIMDTASVGIFLVDREGRITFANQRMAEMFVCPLERLIGSEYIDHIHPDERETGRQRMLALLASSMDSVDLERHYWRDDGSGFWGRLTGQRFVSPEGDKLGLVGVIADIDERKRAFERNAGVIASAMDGFVVTRPDGKIAECNDTICAMSGYTRDEFLSLSIQNLDAAEQPEETVRHIEQIIKGGNDRFESRWRRKDGSIFEIEVTANYLKIGGEICAFVRDISRAKQHERELQHIAHFDTLTGVPNRTLLADRMALGLAQTRRAGTMMAVCYLDLDGFKPINDQFGHEVGDLVLVETARRLQECLRGGDTVARMGGDEFVILLMGLESVDNCEIALKRILAAISVPLIAAEKTFVISASLGAAIFPRDDADADTLLRHADQSMYLAKQTGKNRYHLFDPENDRVARDRSERLARIAEAIERREFVLYYQPQVNMRHGQVQGMEALIRWQHPERGILPPAEFLAVIEDHDLIVDVGDWVIGAALDQIVAWQQVGVELAVGVNIAARQLMRDDFIDRLKAHLARHPSVSPGQLDLEVLETAALDDINRVSAMIGQCRALGVSFSLDDFGTGYSSLTYLKSLPAETLKIDQTFVRDMLVDPEDRAIVQGVIGLARVFQREVIAEGVETVEHGTVLLGLGCERAQGYGIARPMPASAVAGWIAQWRPDPGWSGVSSVPLFDHLQKK